MLKLIFIFCYLFTNYLASSKLVWSQCGQSVFDIHSFDLGSMPIVLSNEIPITLNLTLNRDITGPLKIDVSVNRTISGLQLPIRCYLSYGGCVYKNVCEFFNFISSMYLNKEFTKDNCPEEFLDIGFDCTCPSNLSKGEYYFDTKMYSSDSINSLTSSFNFLKTGTFDYILRMSDMIGTVGCLYLKFTTKP